MAKDKEQPSEATSLDSFPGVRDSIARARARSALAGMLLATLLAYQAGASAWWTGLWALAGGITASLLAWWLAASVWLIALRAEVQGQQRDMLQRLQTPRGEDA